MIAFVKLDNYWASYLPYAFLHMGYHLRKNNVKYTIFHNTFSSSFDTDKKRFLTEIAVLKPSIVGFSVITGRQAKDSAEFSMLLKAQLPGIKILWGGIHPTILPEQCISQPYIDYVLQGEADSTICAFYNEFMNDRHFTNVPGCWWKHDNEILHSEAPLPTESPHNIGLDFSAITNVDDYIYDGGLSIITSRGCPFNCQFCVVQSLGFREWRPFSMALVRETLDLLKSRKIRRIHINDDNFYVDFERAVSILEYAQLPSFSEVRIPSLLKDGRMKILNELHCSKLMSGAESCDEEVLRKIKKGHTFEQMREAMFLFKRYKEIEPSWSFILGMPIESLDNIITTINGKVELEGIVGRRIGHLGIYMPYPGSPMYQIAREKGFREPQNPVDWGCIERYGIEGRNFPPDHELFPWVDIKKVWSLGMTRQKAGVEGAGSESSPQTRETGNSPARRPRADLVGGIKSLIRSVWRKDYDYKRLQSQRSLPQDYTQVYEFVNEDLGILLANVRLSKNDKVLDAGSRDGYLVQRLSLHCDCMGIELIARTARHARRMGRNVLCQDMHHMKFPSCTFQGVIARHSLEHSLDFKKVLREFRRVLVPEGFLFIVIPIERGNAHVTHTQGFRDERVLYDYLDELGFHTTFKRNIRPRGNSVIDYENITISMLRPRARL